MTDLSDAVENADLSALLPFVRSPDDLSFMKDAVYSLDEIMYTAIIENWNEGLRLLLIFSNVDVNAPYMNTEGISKIYSNPLECAITKKNEVAVKLILGRKDLDVDRKTSFHMASKRRFIEAMFHFALKEGTVEIAKAIAAHPLLLRPYVTRDSDDNSSDDNSSDDIGFDFVLDMATKQLPNMDEAIATLVISQMQKTKTPIRNEMLVAMRRLEWRNAFAAAMSEESTLDDLYHTVDDESLLLHLLPRDTKSPHGDDVDFFFFDKLVNHSTFDFHRVRYAVTCKPQFYKQNDDEVPTRRALLRYINHPKMDDEDITHYFGWSYPSSEPAETETETRFKARVHELIRPRFDPSRHINQVFKIWNGSENRTLLLYCLENYTDDHSSLARYILSFGNTKFYIPRRNEKEPLDRDIWGPESNYTTLFDYAHDHRVSIPVWKLIVTTPGFRIPEKDYYLKAKHSYHHDDSEQVVRMCAAFSLEYAKAVFGDRKKCDEWKSFVLLNISGWFIYQEKRDAITKMIEDGKRDPTAYHSEVQAELFGFGGAPKLFALVVLMSDEFLEPARYSSAIRDKDTPYHRRRRFMCIISRLPMELQAILCNMVFGSAKESIPEGAKEKAFRYWGRNLS